MLGRYIASMLFAISFAAANAIADEPGQFSQETQQSLPAVDGLNSKLSFGTLVGGSDAIEISSAITVPLGHRFGFQLDGAAAKYRGELLGDTPILGTAAHLFWRDPTRGMLGLYGEFVHVDLAAGIDIYAGGLEAAFHWGRFTIDGIAGVQDTNFTDADFFNRLRLTYYPIDNLGIRIGHTYAFDQHSILYGAEWAAGGRGGASPALFVDGVTAEDGDSSILAGLRLYLGQRDKSLIRRHREDDPASLTTSTNDSNYDFLVKFMLFGPSGVGN